VKELPNFRIKAELLILKYRCKISQFPVQRCLLQSLVQKWRGF